MNTEVDLTTAISQMYSS